MLFILVHKANTNTGYGQVKCDEGLQDTSQGEIYTGVYQVSGVMSCLYATLSEVPIIRCRAPKPCFISNTEPYVWDWREVHRMSG